MDPRAVFAHARDHLSLLAFQVRDHLIELEELLADQPLALERLAGEVLPAELQRLAGTHIELAKLILPAITLELRTRCFAVTRSATPRRMPYSCSNCWLIAVVEDLHGIFGPVKEPGEPRFESERQSVEHGRTGPAEQG